MGAIAVTRTRALRSLIDLVRRVTVEGDPALHSDRVRDRLGMFTAQVDALSALTNANISRWTRRAERMHDAAMIQVMFCELNLAIATYGVELAGEAGILVAGDAHAVDQGRWQDEWLCAGATTIAGGSSELMRNLIAERGLGLAR